MRGEIIFKRKTLGFVLFILSRATWFEEILQRPHIKNLGFNKILWIFGGNKHRFCHSTSDIIAFISDRQLIGRGREHRCRSHRNGRDGVSSDTEHCRYRRADLRKNSVSQSQRSFRKGIRSLIRKSCNGFPVYSRNYIDGCITHASSLLLSCYIQRDVLRIKRSYML